MVRSNNAVIINLNINIFHVSVECYPWYSYIESGDCIRQSLLNNKWALEQELDGLEPATLRDMLNQKLSRFDGDVNVDDSHQ